jgi:hypothetical protein
MAYEARITQTRTDIDQVWYVFDTDVVTNSAMDTRAARLLQFIADEVAAGTLTHAIEFSDDHLSWSWVNTFADEATWEAFEIRNAAFVANTETGLSGIAWHTETVFTDWCTATGSTVSITDGAV